MKNPLFRKSLFCIACIWSGWIAAFAMPQVSFWPCMFIGLSALYWLYSRTQTAGQAFFTGFFFALGYFVTGLWWIGNALLVEGNDFAWVWPISVIGLPTLLAFFTGTYLGIARMSALPTSFAGFFSFCFFLTFSEWARGNAFAGFPWNLYGYVWADHLAMAQAAHYIGAYGLTFISVIWAAMAGFLIVTAKNRQTKGACVCAVMATMIVVFALGQHRLNTHPIILDKTTGLVVVQPNIAQDMKWDPVAIQNNFQKISSLSKDARFADPQPKNIFIVWPETAISPAVYTIPANMDHIRSFLDGYKKSNAYLITGILRRTEKKPGEVSFANSVTLLDKKMLPLAVYDKYHLVPFGEFIPLQKWIPLKPVAAFKGFASGSGPTTVEYQDIPPFSPLICYEIIFPDQVVGQNVKRPRWIVNVTNDGWYGDSAGPHQHFAQTRLRAIEEGLPVVRSANTGISGVIDSYGRIVDQADIFEEAALVDYLPETITDNYDMARLGVQIALVLLAFLLMPITVIRLKK